MPAYDGGGFGNKVTNLALPHPCFSFLGRSTDRGAFPPCILEQGRLEALNEFDISLRLMYLKT